ncbi:MarR family winged helix-turn-helix transcriptional regulator [Roseomonas sp. AR75]|jgi:DNA-binding MarR family transcriptional regulator|uniref:MarR family winged helix-turn-helix transcriptional regulator n=1 Tax=Roseomonas sp. AR75 TaxID=2562311 RepID=UPI00148597CD|nr:MarR family transcriptional regulator [Roseomonas sp. AR75]
MPATPKLPALTDHLGYWLRLVSNHVSQGFARLVEAEGVTVAEWVVLRVLHDAEDLAPSQLAEAMGMTRGAISKLADRLLAKGLIARRDNAEDARSHRLRLTAAGRRLVPKLAALADRNDAAFFAHLTAAERAAVEQVLRDIVGRRGLTDMPLD